MELNLNVNIYILSRIINYMKNVDLDPLKTIKNKAFHQIVITNFYSNLNFVSVLTNKEKLLVFDLNSSHDFPEFELNFTEFKFRNEYCFWSFKEILIQNSKNNLLLFNISSRVISKQYNAFVKIISIKVISLTHFICSANNQLLIFNINNSNPELIIKAPNISSFDFYDNMIFYGLLDGDIKIIKLKLTEQNNYVFIEQKTKSLLDNKYKENIDFEDRYKSAIKNIWYIGYNTLLVVYEKGLVVILNLKSSKIKEFIVFTSNNPFVKVNFYNYIIYIFKLNDNKCCYSQINRKHLFSKVSLEVIKLFCSKDKNVLIERNKIRIISKSKEEKSSEGNKIIKELPIKEEIISVVKYD